MTKLKRLSDAPFGDALRDLMDDRDLTYRALSRATADTDGKGLTHAHLNMLANGHDKPSMRSMELIAAATRITPDYFVEYRLAKACRDLNPEVVGFEQALKNLNQRLGERRARGSDGAGATSSKRR
jgi:transcriptional regulator with XRE-family HTH domain